jgi:cysteine desulfurase / selenocysteine lyase
MFDMDSEKIRKDFSILHKKINGKSVCYLDSACMSLKPKQVVDSLNRYYNEYSGCAGRSSHKFSKEVDNKVEETRKAVRKFINTSDSKEIIFTRNTTESINLVCHGLGIGANDKVVISDREHNSNLVPWLVSKCKLHIVKSKNDFTFDIERFEQEVKGAKLVSVVWSSNLDGYSLPIKEIVKISHDAGALVLVDGAQWVPHGESNVKKLDIDFLAFSGHKMLGPTGIGVLYGKRELLERLKPFIVGGDTVFDTTYNSYKFEELPARFEAGLQDYAGIIAFKDAVEYLRKIGVDNVGEHMQKLSDIVSDGLKDEKNIEIVGVQDKNKRCGIFNFNVKGINPHDVALLLDESANIMVRSGAHCLHSWFNANKIESGSVRASFYLYNTEDDAHFFVAEMKKVLRMLGK